MRLTLPLIMIVALFSATPGLAKSRGNRAPPASQRRPSGRPRDVARAAPRPAAGRGAKRKQSAGYDEESDGYDDDGGEDEVWEDECHESGTEEGSEVREG